jgi:pimeloyl-ACP methyl ester carboxylesterase
MSLGRARALMGLACLWAAPAHAAPPRQHAVDADGFNVTLWEKSPRKPRAAVLLVHGRTWSGLPNFDLQVSGESRSVMDALAARGFATYAIDLRGYGATPRDSSGWLTPQRAADDVAAALRWIASQRPLAARPALLGYSRGSHVSLLVAQQHPELMSALVLYALPPTAGIAQSVPPAEPPRRATTREAAAEDFITPGATPPAVIEAYVNQAVAANPVRADWRDEHQFAFDAARVTAPTLMIYGANDPLRTDASLAFFGKLATPNRAFVVLPASDHAAHVENAQPAWLTAVDAFLSSPRVPSSGAKPAP